MVFSGNNCLAYSTCNSHSQDNFVFRLCYRWTVLLLIAFSFAVTCRLMFGDSFTCVSDSDSSLENYINVKCYADSTYTLPSKLIIQKHEFASKSSAENFRRYQTYYSWVNLFFLIHAFGFYMPHLFWKSYENGYMRRSTAGIQTLFDKEKRSLELCHLAKYVLVTQGKHKLYTSVYIICEACNYATVLAQTIWLVHFFDVTGVPHFLPFTLKTWSNFRYFYFPPTGICEFRKLGESGILMHVTALCEMPMNSLYMKMFIFLYVWYIFITILTGTVLLYRIVLLAPSFRVFAAKFSAPLAERSILKYMCLRMSYSDWFFLTRLQKTMMDIDFAHVLDKISAISQGKDPQKDGEKSSLFEERMKDFESSGATSPL